MQPYQYTLADTFFEAASALGSADLLVGITNPELPQLGKIVLMVLIWMGRLEIIPVLALLVWPLLSFKRTIHRLW